MTRNEALTGMDKAIETATGTDLEVLKAHRASMVAGWAKQDAALKIKIAHRKQLADDWMKNIDYRIR